jgi:methylmalonyl-CoA/ethylmalonyl-CoA epimerase
MQKIEHIGIAVKNLDSSIALFEKLLNSKCYKTEEVQSEQVRTAFFMVGETKIELLQTMSAAGPIGKYLDKKGEGVHHIAFAVEDINLEMKRMQKEGFTPLQDIAKPGADGKMVCFLHPRDSNAVLVELCMDKPE